MRRLNVVELKNSLGDVLNRAEYQGERVIVHRRGKDSAAIVSIQDLRLLERLLEEAEDRADVDAARESLAESDERTSYEEYRRQRGVADEPEAKKRPARARTGTKAV